MSLAKAHKVIEELKTAPVVTEEQLPKAWTNAWYKAGFRQGLMSALESLASLVSDRHAPKKPAEWQAVYKILMEHRLELMEQMTANERDRPGFIRYDRVGKQYEWYQPMSEAEGYEALKALLEIRRGTQS